MKYLKKEFPNAIVEDNRLNVLTVEELIRLLSLLPPHLKVTYDSGCGWFYGEEIHFNDEIVILND